MVIQEMPDWAKTEEEKMGNEPEPIREEGKDLPRPTVTIRGTGLASGLVKAQKAAKSAKQDARNPHHHYNYTSAEAVIAACRGFLSGAGLALITTHWAESSGRMSIHYRLLHESGDSLDFSASTPILPHKGQPEDKAEFVALTTNLAYFLRGLVLLDRPGADGDDASARDDTDRKPASKPRASRKTTPKLADKPQPKGDTGTIEVTPNLAALQIWTGGRGFDGKDCSAAAKVLGIDRKPKDWTEKDCEDIRGYFADKPNGQGKLRVWAEEHGLAAGPFQSLLIDVLGDRCEATNLTKTEETQVYAAMEKAVGM